MGRHPSDEDQAVVNLAGEERVHIPMWILPALALLLGVGVYAVLTQTSKRYVTEPAPARLQAKGTPDQQRLRAAVAAKESSLDEFRALLESPDDYVAKQASAYLGMLGSEGNKMLVVALLSFDDQRTSTLCGVARSPLAYRHVAELLLTGDRDVQEGSLLFLERAGVPMVEAPPQEGSNSMLAKRDEPSARVVRQALLELWHDRNDLEPARIGVLLGKYASANLAELQALALSKKSTDRLTAAVALGRIYTEPSLSMVKLLTGDPDPDVRAEAGTSEKKLEQHFEGMERLQSSVPIQSPWRPDHNEAERYGR